jgi:hypothetical protein
MKTYQSRWGFHPCDYPTFLKLKRIHKAYWKGLCILAAWQRWSRKLPHNRVIVHWNRDAGGRKINRVIVGPSPEPVVAPIYREICRFQFGIPAEFQKARHGRPEDQVTPLGIPLDVIDRWCEELQKMEPGQ